MQKLSYILAIFIVLISSHTDAETVRYEYLGRQEGLSNSSVSCITIDSSGYLWAGTLNGLNRYDGSEFKTFYYSQDEPSSLSGNEVKCLYIDMRGSLWVGTSFGLSLYNEETESFTNFKYENNNDVSLSHNNISQIDGDSLSIWIATSNGLNRLMLDNHTITRYYSHALETTSDELQDIALNGQDGIWIAHYSNGLDYYQFADSSAIHFGKKEQHQYFLPEDNPESLLLTKNGVLWVGYESGKLYTIEIDSILKYKVSAIEYGFQNANIISISEGNDCIYICTDQNGLIKIHNNKKVEHLNNSNAHSLSNDKIWSAFEDKNETLWIGHFRGGISKRNKKFAHRLKTVSIPSNHPNAQIITSIAEIDSGLYALGSDGDGLYKYSVKDQLCTPLWANHLKNEAVLSLLHTKNNTCWVGTYAHGLKQINLQTNTTRSFIPVPSTPKKGPSGTDIRDIVQIEGTIWFCDHANYLNSFDTASLQFTHHRLDYKHPTLGMVFPSPWCMKQLNDSTLAIGTNRGLLVFHTNSSKFDIYWESGIKDKSVSSNSVRSLYLDKTRKTLIIGTENGLDIMDITSMKIHPSGNQILANTFICGIERSEPSFYWLTTKSGIARTDSLFENIQWFDISDGLPSNEFVENSIFATNDGKILCGNAKGAVIVEPKAMRLNEGLPRLIFSDLFLNYNKIGIGESPILPVAINTLETLEIPYSFRTLGVSFSSLSFIQSHKNTYAVMLDGFDDTWRKYSSENTVTYTNLAPGSYTLKVKTKNNDGIESKERHISLQIIPPFYKTIWFQILLGIICFIAILVIIQIRTKQVQKRNKFLQKHNLLLSKEIVERKQAETELIQSKEIAESANKAKSEFLANMSHEIRTPLNAVHGFCEILATTEINGSQQKYIDSIKIASDGLLTLINDLLDLSKIEAGQIEIKNIPVRIRNFLQEITYMFELMGKQKEISVQLNFEESVPEIVLIDATRLRQILVNLLGNAIKFTDKGSVSINVSASTLENNSCALKISIIDTGIGIRNRDLQHIFNSFSQVEASSTRKYEGTGLGLAICKKMVELMNGSIGAESTIGSGSTFTISFTDLEIASTEILLDNEETEKNNAVKSRAFVVAPIYEYLENLTEILISLKYDVSVFSKEDIKYILSIQNEGDIIILFNANEYTSDMIPNESEAQIISINKTSNSKSRFSEICPPFSKNDFIATLKHSTHKMSSKSNTQEMALSTDEKNFIDNWLKQIAPFLDVFDTQEIENLNKELHKKGIEHKNQTLLTVSKTLEEAIDIFDLNTIEKAIKMLRDYYNH